MSDWPGPGVVPPSNPGPKGLTIGLRLPLLADPSQPPVPDLGRSPVAVALEDSVPGIAPGEIRLGLT